MNASQAHDPAAETSPSPGFDIKEYRQPLVTSLGVMLGFLIGFLAQWISEDDFSLGSAADALVFCGCLAGAFLMLLVLFRMLSPPPPGDGLGRYRTTLRLYISGVATAFLSLLVAAFL